MSKDETKKDSVGRPTKMTKEVLQKLEKAFLNSATDQEACWYAGIATTTFYNYCEQNPEFREWKEDAKKKVGLQAKLNLVTVINDAKHPDNIATSKFWLERKSKAEFSARQELTGADGEGVQVLIVDDLMNTGKDKK